ncbi:ribonuclease T1 [Oryzisolibacter propanilivorax]|uniref:Ribonuclease T1 n=1 Tax=Oryzisolibacter propanilivorax TaxID=1527607 RepID=A0A1G9QP91_9BURK|nr:ribonuclease domain-containing protein [Oryzisolibacter propanilivorax]SDM12818.1 ribonuclease T1 [Oryzisolibacter propanilivorax]
MFKAGALAVRKAFVACAVGAAVLLAPAVSSARLPSPPLSAPAAASAPIALAELPTQGRATYALIHAGGPFPHDKDGAVFGNRERLLPAQRRGYWREYTVRTPGVRHRGARRIVCGGALPRTPEVCYYTSDHYASFREIAP